jgi:hypothetical protein
VLAYIHTTSTRSQQRKQARARYHVVPLLCLAYSIAVAAAADAAAHVVLQVTEWISEEGDVVRMLIDSGAGLIEAVLSTKVRMAFHRVDERLNALLGINRGLVIRK